MSPQQIRALIETGLPGATAVVRGDDGVHFEAVVVSPAFKGLSMVRQHQLVYQTLGGKMGAEIHALSLKTLTPEEWAATGS